MHTGLRKTVNIKGSKQLCVYLLYFMRQPLCAPWNFISLLPEGRFCVAKIQQHYEKGARIK